MNDKIGGTALQSQPVTGQIPRKGKDASQGRLFRQELEGNAPPPRHGKDGTIGAAPSLKPEHRLPDLKLVQRMDRLNPRIAPPGEEKAGEEPADSLLEIDADIVEGEPSLAPPAQMDDARLMRNGEERKDASSDALLLPKGGKDSDELAGAIFHPLPRPTGQANAPAADMLQTGSAPNRALPKLNEGAALPANARTETAGQAGREELSAKTETTVSGDRLPKAPATPSVAHDARMPDAQAEIRVMSVQRLPAPAQTGEAEPHASHKPAPAGSTQTGMAAPSDNGRPLQILKIQIHPAELGMVTARLRLVSEQLSVELQVETAEARQRLSSDSEAIVKALRSLGYEIDRVTVQQAPHNASASANRDGSSHQMGSDGGSAEGQSRRMRDETGQDRPARPNRGMGQGDDDAHQSGLYI